MRYTPEPLSFSPSNVTTQELTEYLQRALAGISAAIDGQADGNLEVFRSAPARPRQGMLRYADGVAWDPGSGDGLYVYDGSAWSIVALSMPLSILTIDDANYSFDIVSSNPRMTWDTNDYLSYTRSSNTLGITIGAASILTLTSTLLNAGAGVNIGIDGGLLRIGAASGTYRWLNYQGQISSDGVTYYDLWHDGRTRTKAEFDAMCSDGNFLYVGGTGDVVGPASAVNNNIAVFDTTTGKLIKDGGSAIAGFALLASSPLFTGTVSGATGLTAGAGYHVSISGGGQFVSSTTTGTSPLFVVSTTVNSNLNADLLDGYHAAAFAQLAGATFSGTVRVPLLEIDGANFYLDSDVVSNDSSVVFDSGDYLRYAKGVNEYYFRIGSATYFQIGTTTAYSAGNLGCATTLYSNVATGTAPIAVNSTTLCTNLTANYLGAVSQDAAFFRNASNINAGTIGNSYVNWASPSAIGTGTPQDGTFKSVIISGSGTYSAGAIYSDSNWGLIYRAKVAGTLADHMWANSAGTVEQLRIPAQGGIGLPDGQTVPTTVTGIAFIYVDTADGDLKVKFGDGTVKTLATDT